MKRDRAIKIAVEAMERQVKELNWDANLFEQTGVGVGNQGERAYQKRKQLQDAINTLRQPQQISMEAV